MNDMANNYARHVGNPEERKRGTGLVVFFANEPPLPKDEWPEWAFFRVPGHLEPSSFGGKLVAEDGDQRTVRLKRRR
jgi:hypothetical protein